LLSAVEEVAELDAERLVAVAAAVLVDSELKVHFPSRQVIQFLFLLAAVALRKPKPFSKMLGDSMAIFHISPL
jgi:hypothetical protein